MHYADAAYCEGAIHAALEDFVEGRITTPQLVEFFCDVAMGRGCGAAEVLDRAERAALVLSRDRWEAVKSSVKIWEGAESAQEREDQATLMSLIRSMTAHGGQPDLPMWLASPCGLLILLDHWFGSPGEADTQYELRMVDNVIHQYLKLLHKAMESCGIGEEELRALHHRSFRTRVDPRLLS